MTDHLRILVTGSRRWANSDAVREALQTELRKHPTDRPAILVHGGAGGLDSIAASIWREWVTQYPALFVEPEVHPAGSFPTPMARNLHMVSLGAESCAAFAELWASGTGHCARAARRAGIPTTDYGVPTEMRSRSGAAA